MGFFGDLNKLRIMGEEQEAKMDVKGTMNDAKARLDAMNAAYAAAAPKPEDPANMMQGVQVTLLVMLPSGIPMPVTTQLMVPILNMMRLQPGALLQVSIDPTDPNSVRIDWSK